MKPILSALHSTAHSVLVAALLVGASVAQEPFCVAFDTELLSSSAGPFESLGRSVALDGTRAAVGSSTGRRVTLFQLDVTTWTEEIVLQPISAGPGWGTAVALAGQMVAVGAPLDSTDGPDAGSVTVFRFDGTNWMEDARLSPTVPVPGSHFGSAVAVDGDRVAVGAPGDDLSALTGRVYVFLRSNGTWGQEALLSPATGPALGFGSALAMDLPTLLVGSPGTDTVHTYRRPASTWVELAGLTAPVSGVGFGWSVDLEGSRAVVGAPFDDTLGTNAGSASVYIDNGAFWTLEQSLVSGVGRDALGVDVALDGDRILVGADGAPTVGSAGTVLAAGHAVLFEKRRGGWQQQAIIERAGGHSADFFGRALDLEGDVLLIGASGADDQGMLAGSATSWRMGPAQTSFGAGLPGTGGLVPEVALTDCAAVGQGFDITVSNGVGGGLGLLFWSGQAGSLPFAGGAVLVGFPITVQLPHVLSGTPGVAGAGSFAFPALLPDSGILGQTLFLQAGYLDAGAAQQYSLSAGLEIQFPGL